MSDGERSGDGGRDAAERGTGARWLIAFLIGLATVTAAGYAWRAAQIGSTAAFDDRQSISETIAVGQGRVQRAVTVAGQAREYVRYRADYVTAAALDREAARLRAAGDTKRAEDAHAEARELRLGATRRAADAGVFGRATIGSALLTPTVTPRPFDYRASARALEVEASASIDSPANLDPDRWAAEAAGIRDRIGGLTRWAFLILVAVLAYTLAEVAATRRLVTYALVGAGLAFYLVGLVGGLTTYFF
jgi:hypothetical protein